MIDLIQALEKDMQRRSDAAAKLGTDYASKGETVDAARCAGKAAAYRHAALEVAELLK